MEYDDCVTICNVVNKGTPLDPELLTAGDQCCKVRQIQAVEGGPRGDGANAQGGTFSLPGYTKAIPRLYQSSVKGIPAQRLDSQLFQAVLGS